MRHEGLTRELIGAAIEVHRHWGPGLYEEIYQRSMCVELRLRGVEFQSQHAVPLVYKGEKIADDLRVDILVPGLVVVELKAVKALEPVHQAQLLTYMKLTECKVGLLINFNEVVLRKGIKRLVL